jgi:hypothetical protein
MQWWVRSGGSQTNGGGFDATVSGSGINYADRDTAIGSASNFATPSAGSTTLTSASNPFTSGMIGNVIRFSAGTNFATGHYVITGYTSSSQVTLDRSPTASAAGSGGVGSIGGALLDLRSFATSSSAGGGDLPAFAAPVAAGHVINFRCSTSLADPSTPDWTTSNYYTFPAGNTTGGSIRLIGYNGRPLISALSLWFYQTSGWHFTSISIKSSGVGAVANFFNTCDLMIFEDCIFDQNGVDMGACGDNSYAALGCLVRNSGSTSAGISAAFPSGSYGDKIIGCRIDGWRGPAITVGSVSGSVLRNVIANCHCSGGAVQLTDASFTTPALVMHNVFYNNASHGLEITQVNPAFMSVIRNNIFWGNGGYGIKYLASTGDSFARGKCDYNALGSNTSGAYSNFTGGTHDVVLTGDPFTNAAAKDFSLNNAAGAGAVCKSVGWPLTIP